MALSTPVSTGFIESFKSALADVDIVPIEPLGTIRYERNSVYKYVKFSGTTAVAVGDALCYVLSDANGQTVDNANSAVGAGIAVAVVASGTIQYGWVQIEGQVILSTTTGAAAGNQLTNTGAGAHTLKVAAAVTDQVIGVLFSVSAPISALVFYPH